jgi:hypothetical protein
MLKYKITSKIKPSVILMVVTCDDFEASKKRQLFMLSHSMHPTPIMYNHLIKYGIHDFDFIPIIENEMITPQKEVRKRKV